MTCYGIGIGIIMALRWYLATQNRRREQEWSMERDEYIPEITDITDTKNRGFRYKY
jgi:hypothetical protein